LLFPSFFLYLTVLGGFLPLAANALASGIAWPSALAKLPAWIWFIFPAAYVLADFIEDCLIVMMMSQPATINDRTINLLTAFRKAKIGANSLAIIQIFVLGLAGTIRLNRRRRLWSCRIAGHDAASTAGNARAFCPLIVISIKGGDDGLEQGRRELEAVQRRRQGEVGQAHR
jgi:hypothetical protein